MRLHHVLGAAALAAAAACSHESSPCDPSSPSACGDGKVCESVSGGKPACFPPVLVKGAVTDLATGAAIAGARVVALDSNRAPASAVATTDTAGAYSLAVPATRSASGAPTTAITLRTDAQAYQSFPGGIRAALPIDLSTAALSTDGRQWVVDGALTSVGLLRLPDTANLLSISGKVERPASRVGVLVVAEPQTGGRGLTAIADADGSYTIFNLPGAASPGVAYAVSAYAKGVNYAPGAATLVLGASAPAVDLVVKNLTAPSIAGDLIFNAGASTPTTVALVVASTYDAALDRGEAPPGLVAAVTSSSGYAIAGVPDGEYVALAAFGIDGDVRNVSGTGNTAPVPVQVRDGTVLTAPSGFKIVAAVDLSTIDGAAVTGDGVPARVTSATPRFGWVKGQTYASAATFEASVLDAFGNVLWTDSQSGSGGGPFSASYAGATALEPGTFYQLRIKALDGAGNQLSQTEDLKGVFYYQP